MKIRRNFWPKFKINTHRSQNYSFPIHFLLISAAFSAAFSSPMPTHWPLENPPKITKKGLLPKHSLSFFYPHLCIFLTYNISKTLKTNHLKIGLTCKSNTAPSLNLGVYSYDWLRLKDELLPSGIRPATWEPIKSLHFAKPPHLPAWNQRTLRVPISIVHS